MFGATMGVRISVQSLWTKSSSSVLVYEFAQSRIVVGRARSADVQLPHPAVSGTHASIREEGTGYVLIDEGSTNGTRVNEALVVPGRAKTLCHEDVIDLGGYRLAVELGVPVATTMSARLSGELARRLLAEQLGMDDAREVETELGAIQNERDQPIELLPIARERPSESPPRSSRPSRPRPSRPSSYPPVEQTPALGRGAIAVYALAAFVVVASVLAMVLLMRP
jgi:pSer/pThr/pTyr-binding forkhead associated (FHA) protein